ncbi:MAG: MBL fold metallo-hydrolase [Spirochaetota bacterium]
MNTRITVICENTAGYSTKLLGEHGLSMLIETDGGRFLLDTGSGDTLLHNMTLLGIDPASIDAVLLSHGHRDHTGGLKVFLDKRRARIPVYCHGDVFSKRFSCRGAVPKEISIPFQRGAYEEAGADFVIAEGRFSLTPEISIYNEIPENPSLMCRDGALKIRIGETMTEDPFRDDTSLSIKTESGLSILTGCAHKGIVNIIEHIAYCEEIPGIYAIAGGSHLRDDSEEYISIFSETIRKFSIRGLSLGHCTGFNASAQLHCAFPGIFNPLFAGYSFTL